PWVKQDWALGSLFSFLLWNLFLQHRLHNPDLGSLSVVSIRRKIEQLGILTRTWGIKQILHHCQSAIVVLNHSRQKQMIEFGVLGLPQRFHLFWWKHSRHEGHRVTRLVVRRHFDGSISRH